MGKGELNHDKSMKIYFFCVKRHAKNDFLKYVESTVEKMYIITYESSVYT